MEYDSASSCEGRLRDLDTSEDVSRLKQAQSSDHLSPTTPTKPWQSLQVATSQPPLKLGTANRSLSSQVMEYYQKYSQSSNLDQYFSLPGSSSPPEAVKYYYSIYELNPKLGASRQDCIGEEYNLRSYVPRERRRWARPPLIGQSSSGEGPSRYIQPLTDPQSPSPDRKHVTTDAISEDKNESQETLPEAAERKLCSPTSSITSHKPLEWDSGADVGYFNTLPNSKQHNKKLSTIERMALARGCSAALRLDPEGTTESGISGKITGNQRNVKKLSSAPDANSTPLVENASGSESEIEITPIMKNHLPGIITGNGIMSEKRNIANTDVKQQETILQSPRKEFNDDTRKSSFPFKMPCGKYLTEGKRVTSNRQMVNKETAYPSSSPLKKSTSMSTLVIPASKSTLKRSQSELNLHVKAKAKAAVPLIFNSTSSIATVVNKPATCDKVIQTSLNAFTQESIGVQVSVIEEEKPPLPKRGTSLQKSLHSILKNSKEGTYKVRHLKNQKTNREQCSIDPEEDTKENQIRHSSPEPSRHSSAPHTPQPDDTENVSGRANSFEYFPGHIYENVPNGSGSHVSSSDTGRSNSTLPNTSSSVNEKLWGDSDSLVRDLERSVNILKSLVDANKCDKNVKKRLIHHVVRRLIVAKYTDDKIEHNLEDNVPWNPDNTRSKVYRSEILQSFAKKHSTSDSSEEWNRQKKSACTRKSTNSTDIMKEVGIESCNSDKFDKNTDRTETDGRKARMGLRTEDRHRTSNTATDPDKSESSECFFPQRGRKSNKVQDIFGLKEKCKMPREDTTTTSTPPDHNRMLLDAVVNNRRTAMISSNNTEENIDWRLFPTLSERQFELKKRNNSDSGDSKLVSYAEMEKRNQLIWITNEISHLCNLKKLLEQPRKAERPRTSPRKAKSGNFKTKPMSVLAHTHGSSREADYVRRNTLDERTNSVEQPWSSHCNLATYQPTTSTINSLIRRVKKRNSCAQTATNVTGAHSKTGGEIVSASNLQSTTIKLVSTGVQTLPQETPAIPTLIQSEIVHYIKCPAHKTMMHCQNSYKCKDQACQCQRHAVPSLITTCVHCSQEQSPTQPIVNRAQRVHGNSEYLQEEKPNASHTPLNQTNSSSVTSLDVIHHCTSKESSQFKQKETKNQINASKSKYPCDCKVAHTCQWCATDCRSEVNAIEDKSAEYKKPLSKICQLCSVKIVAVESSSTMNKCDECCKKMACTHEKDASVTKKCTCMNACDSESDRFDPNKVWTHTRSVPKYHQGNGYVSTYNQNGRIKLCECSTDCSCDTNCELDAHKKKGLHDCRSLGKAHYNGVHHCACCSKLEEIQNQKLPYCANNVQDNESSHQHKVQNSLKCNCEEDSSCMHKAKGVEEKSHARVCNGKANFPNENDTSDSEGNRKYCPLCGTLYQNARKCSCRQTYPKAIAYELSFAKENGQKNDNSSVVTKVPLSNGGKTDGCACNMIKKTTLNKNPQQKKSLQEYLSKNKPDFVDNAETRRQYMSEISHLRQLRKEKRIQLLAMATTSNMIKAPKASAKSTACVQKRMTDEEMKERLRKRYLRLNEVRSKRRQQERQEEARRNKLMAKIFCKKLQQKVLRGQVDLSQSVSVITNI